ncbi:MAG TPA: GDSL-type esterase/lipase family protein [Isosphaeraceae bacterium]|nr:GDSL-type esterase/lipase family protein [Isosphaeraceae bacterium]
MSAPEASPAPPTAPPPRARRRLAIALAAALVAAVGLDVVLARALFASYRDLHSLRLDPTDAARFAGVRVPPRSPGMTRVVLVGDSRVEAWADPPSPSGCEAINRGVDRQTTAQVLLRLDRDVIALEADVAVVQVGVNDLKTLGLFADDRAATVVEGCRAHLREIVGRLRDAGITVVLLTIFPVGPPELARRPIWSDATIDAIDDVNRTIRGLAGPGVVVVDCDTRLRRGRRIDPALALDTLHLGPAGYRALNEAVRPALERAVRDRVSP